MRKYYRENAAYRAKIKAYQAKGKWRERYNRVKNTPEYRKRVLEYSRNPKKRAYDRVYWKTPKGRAYRKKLRQSPKAKANRLRYRALQRVQEWNREYSKRYAKTPKGREVRRRMRAIRRERTRDGDVTTDWVLWLQKITKYCILCGVELTGQNTQIDHIELVSLGGQHMRWNLRLLCGRCNRKRPRTGADTVSHLMLNGIRLKLLVLFEAVLQA